MSTLKKKTINSVVWSSIQRFGTMFITFVSNIVLARLLSPDDYGCIAMLMIFISLANTFIDGGFGSALIQKKDPTNEDYSTIFYWNIAFSIVLYGILFATAPLIARFYKMPLLIDVLRVQGVVLFFNALSIVQQNQLQKNLEFKKLSIVYIVSASLSLLVAIVAAYHGMGVWSLVIQQVFISFLHALLFWMISKWHPALVFSLKSFKELFGFGGFMLLSQLYSTLSNEIQGLLIGFVFNSSTLGLYNQAYRLEGSAATSVSSIINQVTYPVLSSIQDDRKSFVSALKRFIQIPAYLCSLVMMLMILTAKPLIILLFSEKWVESAPYFQILCTAGLAVCLQGSANNAIAAIGKSHILFTWTIVKRTLTIILCVMGIFLAGMNGLLLGCVAGSWSVYFINAYLVHKHVGYHFVNQLMDILPSMLLSVIIGFLAYWMGLQVKFDMYVTALLQIGFFVVVYLLMSWLLQFDSFKYLTNLLVSFIHKKVCAT